MPGRHNPNRLGDYMNAHNRATEDFVRGGFVTRNGVAIQQYGPGVLLIQGEYECAGGIVLEVWKELLVSEGRGERALVRRGNYSYNARLRGRGNILRYDSPHEHRACHHVHRFDTLDSGREEITLLQDEDDTPTLGDVLNELQAWHDRNAHQLSST